MPTVINLVCTRCTDGDHGALQHWYNDHAQLLMASRHLRSAQLFQLQQTTADIDYFCAYEFSGFDDFAAFDSGSVMQEVRNSSNAAAGRSSIEIVKRTQYERLIHRRWIAEGAGLVQASLFALQSGNLSEVTRWFNDALYALHLKQPMQSAQVYAAATPGGFEIFVVLQAAGASPLPLDWHASESQYAARPSIEVVWQASAECIAQWLR